MGIRWPGLPYEQWAETRDTPHLRTQAIGEVKLAPTPFRNEWWNVASTLSCRGMTTSDGRRAFIDLAPRSVAEFHAIVTALAGWDHSALELPRIPEREAS